MEDFQKKKNQKPKCKLVGEYPKDIKVKKSDLEGGKDFNEIKIEYKNIGAVNWNKKYTIELVNNYNENINISNFDNIENEIKKGESYKVNITLMIFELEQEKYVLEFVLKNEKNDIVENSKAVFNLILENEEPENNQPKKKNPSNEEPEQNNDSNDFLSNEEEEQIYNELCEEFNIQNLIDKDVFIVKLKELIKKEKKNYTDTNRDEILGDLKEKMMDLIY